MPFRVFALIVIGVLATSAASVWLAAAVAIRFHVAPLPVFGIVAIILVAATLLERKRNG